MSQKMKSALDVAALLALRDGEPVDAERISGDPEQIETGLATLEHLKARLNDLPDVEVDESAWLGAARPARAPIWTRQPLATAASVVLVSALFVYGLVGGVRDLSGTGTQLPDAVAASPAMQPSLVDLMDRSRDLETVAYGTAGWRSAPADQSTLDMSAMGEVILLELARVDADIQSLEDTGNEQAARLLWERRVILLQAFIADMANSNPGRFEDNRSM